ncbi:MAG: hypothetical protein HC913_06745 [Microscillaceae bacterium]|nr:hypothetical protein [Microscillaceae bacterium]
MTNFSSIFKFLFVCLVFGLVACQESSDEVKPSSQELLKSMGLPSGVLSMMDYHNIINSRPDAIFWINRHASHATSSAWVGFQGVAYDYNNVSDVRFLDAPGSLKIGNFQIGKQSTAFHQVEMDNASARALYGSSVNFQFTGGNTLDRYGQNKVYPPANESLYVPTKIQFSQPFPLLDPSVQKSRGIQLNWNADPRNGKGVMLLMRVNPASGLSNPNWQWYHLLKVIPDNGQYFLSPQDLENFLLDWKLKLI